MTLPNNCSHYHLPGLFEFYDFYKVFLPLYREHREYFYDWCDIASIYGSPTDCLWGGGRAAFGEADVDDVISLMDNYEISARLTFSNSLFKEDHLTDSCKLETVHILVFDTSSPTFIETVILA